MGEWDMCRNGEYTERGIKARNGYGAERFRIEPEFTVKLDAALGLLGVLLEPDQHRGQSLGTYRIRRRTLESLGPKELLVTGAGPSGFWRR